MEPHTTAEIASVVLIDIAVIVTVARVMGLLFRRLGQPAVVAEILAALALGPSLLGTLPGNPTEVIFPQDVRPYLTVIATLGLVIFMFIVGLELDLGLIRGKGRTAATISISSVILPFATGAALALWLYGAHDEGGVEKLPFVLFIGASMSVTAFPVLARILTERGMQRTSVGVLALACAAVDDVLAWTMLAAVLAVVRASGTQDLVIMIVEALAFVATMLLIVKPMLRGLVRRRNAAGRLTPDLFAIVLVGVLVSSFLTDRIGIHAIFGAFLFGAIMPREGAAVLTQEILERVEQLTVLVLLPVFFITTGLDVNVGDLGVDGVIELGAVLLVACGGKFFGAALAARAVGVPGRRAGAVGVLMNARGLTELVILTIGKESGVLDDRLFTVMVLMAIITTVMTEPLLRLFYSDRLVAREIALAEREELGLSADYRVVTVVNESQPEQMVDLGVALLGDEASSQLVISRFDPPVHQVEVGSGLASELAAVAASFEHMQGLERRATASGASAVVRSQFSGAVSADLDTQVRAADADAVVISTTDADLAHDMLETADCAVILVIAAGREVAGSGPGPGGGPALSRQVALIPRTGPDGLAAVEQACRLASRLGSTIALQVGADRRDRHHASAIRDRLAKAGIPMSQSPESPELGRAERILVAGWSDWRRRGDDLTDTQGYEAVLLVRAALGDSGDSLTKLLDTKVQDA
ncbi:cation:proton antiporter [Aeromicrobium sp. A1-2]|uniref:cation:proton antiporter n=1 Tax=Aeromicrobium sp. A1-2 TaxID=2107713 RepID=UPI0013C334B3|nr:cation:proton antiporter [Aeromicrobium sp. A1-2]